MNLSCGHKKVNERLVTKRDKKALVELCTSWSPYGTGKLAASCGTLELVRDVSSARPDTPNDRRLIPPNWVLYSCAAPGPSGLARTCVYNLGGRGQRECRPSPLSVNGLLFRRGYNDTIESPIHSVFLSLITPVLTGSNRYLSCG